MFPYEDILHNHPKDHWKQHKQSLEVSYRPCFMNSPNPLPELFKNFFLFLCHFILVVFLIDSELLDSIFCDLKSVLEVLTYFHVLCIWSLPSPSCLVLCFLHIIFPCCYLSILFFAVGPPQYTFYSKADSLVWHDVTWSRCWADKQTAGS